MPFRQLLFWAHLTAGIIAGAVILTMSVTGVLLGFERQIVALLERDLRANSHESRREPLPLSELLAAASAASPGAAPSQVTIRSDRRDPAAVTFGRQRTLFVDRSSGTVLGEGAKRVRRFFAAVEDLHRSLALKAGGKKVTGAANLAFLFIVLSGPYLWIPRRRTRSAFRNVTWFRRGLRGRTRDFNWHNVLGIWAFVPLIAIVFSGVVISYPWASALVYRAFGSQPPPRPPNGAPQGAGESIDGRLDRLWSSASAEAERIAPGWQSLSVRLPLPDEKPVSFALDAGNGARPDKRSQLLLDPRSGRLVEHKTYAAQTSGQKARAWLRWIHTGEAGGLAGQLVATLATAAAVVLVWTGIALALRRFRRRQRGVPETVTPQQQLEEFEA